MIGNNHYCSKSIQEKCKDLQNSKDELDAKLNERKNNLDKSAEIHELLQQVFVNVICIFMFICLQVCMSVCLYVYMSVSVCMSVCLSLRVCVCVCICVLNFYYARSCMLICHSTYVYYVLVFLFLIFF